MTRAPRSPRACPHSLEKAPKNNKRLTVCKDHRDKIKVLDPVVKDLISKKYVEQIIEKRAKLISRSGSIFIKRGLHPLLYLSNTRCFFIRTFL